MKNYAISILVIISLLTGFIGLFYTTTIASSEDSTKTSRKVFFCWGFDDTGAQAWIDWLNLKGFTALKFKAEEANSTDLSAVELIIIGSDTGSNWSDNTNLFGIIHSSKPILAMGSGGAKYLWNAGAGTGGHYQIYSNIQAVTANDTNHEIYNVPNKMPYSDMYVYDSQRSGTCYKLADLPNNVTILGKDTSDLDWALITNETSGMYEYTTWGFNTADPANLNDEGKLLFENVVWFALGGYPVPEINDILFLSFGATGLFAFFICYIRRKKT